ncbi:MAG: rare lipoprotein [Solirubrobacteraceae bacterium]|jgi:hypothetical protein|nr:rare lipoprotein [Solirubrobacteraceae bacterium]
MRTVKATLAAVLCLSAGLALPAGAAANGGLAAPEPGSAPARTGATAPGSADGTSGALTVGRAALFGRRQRITGTLGRAAGQDVLVQRSDRAGWVTIARARTGSGGAFAATWRADSVGRLTLRAVSAASGAATAASAAPTAALTVYRADIATHFGEGFYGSRTACGITLTPRTVGVAHKTLPCGTVLEFYYRGRTVRAPVVDRGPYANNAAWDLTMPASRALGFSGKDYVGAIAVGRMQLRAR